MSSGSCWTREVRILEISFGEFDEEDIVRLDDVYGRVAP
jgi:mannose-6-phosphate isomerase